MSYFNVNNKNSKYTYQIQIKDPIVTSTDYIEKL